MTRCLDIVAHVDDEFQMPEILVEIRSVSALLLQNLNILINLDQISVDTIDLFVPFKRVNLRLKYLVVFFD